MPGQGQAGPPGATPSCLLHRRAPGLIQLSEQSSAFWAVQAVPAPPLHQPGWGPGKGGSLRETAASGDGRQVGSSGRQRRGAHHL